MSMHAHHQDQAASGSSPPSRPRTPAIVRLLMIALLAVGAFYVIAEHGAHLLSAWPLLILLLCPLMHIFMHGGHGGHGSHGGRNTPQNERSGSAHD